MLDIKSYLQNVSFFLASYKPQQPYLEHTYLRSSFKLLETTVFFTLARRTASAHSNNNTQSPCYLYVFVVVKFHRNVVFHTHFYLQ